MKIKHLYLNLLKFRLNSVKINQFQYTLIINTIITIKYINGLFFLQN